MKLMTTAMIAACALALIPAAAFARGGGHGGSHGGGKRSYSSHSYKTPSKSRSGGSRQASSGNYASGSQAGDGTCYTGPRGGRYTITPSGNKKYGC